MIAFRWKCPSCGRDQIVDQAHLEDQRFLLRNEASRHGPVGLKVVTIACTACGGLAATLSLHRAAYPTDGGFTLQEELATTVLEA
jgi:hypothetical protein